MGVVPAPGRGGGEHDADRPGRFLDAIRRPAGLRALERRRTIDPDGFGGGFGVWSGTSFAAPLMAGDLAELLLRLREDGRPDPMDWAGTAPVRCAAAWATINQLTGLPAPS